MTNRKLRQALLAKLDITPQGLSYRVQKLKQQHAITTEDATYVIAQHEGIVLDKYLNNETVDRVRGLMQQISSKILPSAAEKRDDRRKIVAKTEDGRIIVVAKEFKGTDPVLPQSKLMQAKEMASIYPLLYILENSIREVIDRVMVFKYGANWWDTQAPKGLKKTVKDRMDDEKRNSWHQRRGARPIDYLDLGQLNPLMRKIEKDVVPYIIPDIEWFTQLVEEVNKSRRVICHMNPLNSVNIQSVKLRLTQWQNQIKAKLNNIPKRP